MRAVDSFESGVAFRVGIVPSGISGSPARIGRKVSFTGSLSACDAEVENRLRKSTAIRMKDCERSRVRDFMAAPPFRPSGIDSTTLLRIGLSQQSSLSPMALTYKGFT